VKRLLLISLISVVVFAACNQTESVANAEDDFEVTEKPVFAAAGGGLLMRISNPDEAVAAINEFTDGSDWTAYLESDTTIDAESDFSVGFLLGARSANALVYAALGDWDRAEAISDSVRVAAERLDVQTDDTEALIQALVAAFEEPDEELREVRVSRALNALRGQIVRTLNTLDEESIALAIELGAWLEGSRQAAGVTRDNYSEELSVVLMRGTESQYFLETLQRVAVQESLQESLNPLIEEMRTVSAIMNSAVLDAQLVGDLYDTIETARTAALGA